MEAITYKESNFIMLKKQWLCYEFNFENFYKSYSLNK